MDNKTGDYFLFPVRLLLLTLSVGDVNKFYHLLCVGVCYNQMRAHCDEGFTIR